MLESTPKWHVSKFPFKKTYWTRSEIILRLDQPTPDSSLALISHIFGWSHIIHHSEESAFFLSAPTLPFLLHSSPEEEKQKHKVTWEIPWHREIVVISCLLYILRFLMHSYKIKFMVILPSHIHRCCQIHMRAAKHAFSLRSVFSKYGNTSSLCSEIIAWNTLTLFIFTRMILKIT